MFKIKNILIPIIATPSLVTLVSCGSTESNKKSSSTPSQKTSTPSQSIAISDTNFNDFYNLQSIKIPITNGIQNTAQTGKSTLSHFSQNQLLQNTQAIDSRINSLQGVQKSTAFGSVVEITKRSYAIAKKIQELMSKEVNIRWHLTGDNMIDGFNAVRYTIWKWAHDDNSLKNLLKDFIDDAFPDQRKALPITNQNGPGNGWDFSESAKEDINNWLDKDQPIFLVDSGGVVAVTSANPNPKFAQHLYRNYPLNKMTLDKEFYKKTEPLRLNLERLQTSQVRAQMIDWRGSFDLHHATDTYNNEIKIWDGQVSGSKGLLATAPALTNPPYNESLPIIRENLLVPFRYVIENVDATEVDDNKSRGGIDFVEALLTAIATLYDSNDGSATTGHRVASFDPSLDVAGWSMTYIGDSNFAQFFFHTGDEIVYSDQPIASAVDTEKEYPWLKTLWPNGLATKIVAQTGVKGLLNSLGMTWGDGTDINKWTFYTTMDPNGVKAANDAIEHLKGATNINDLNGIVTVLKNNNAFGMVPNFTVTSPSGLHNYNTFYNPISPTPNSITPTNLYNPNGGGTIYGYIQRKDGYDYETLPQDFQ